MADRNRQILQAESQALATASRIQYFNLVIKKGKGAILTDENDHQYIDLLASASATNTGHAHPHVVQAICEQSQNLIEYTPAYFANPTTAKLAQRLVQLAPMSGSVEVAWGNSGSDANDAIIKFARAYTKRPYIVCFTGAYHGSTYGSMSVSSVSLNMARKMGPLLPDIIRVPYPDSHEKLAGESEADFVQRMFHEFQLPFNTYLPAEEVAAILIEPIQGDGGIVKAPQQYLELVAQFAHNNGILLAIDEVNQGMGRTGKWWSIQHFGIEPDLMSMGKSLASGMPLSAVVGRKEIMESLAAPANVYTTAGNPVVTAAANATIDVIEQEHLVERSHNLGQIAEQFFQEEQAKYDFIGEVRMYGLNGGIDIVNPQTKQPDVELTTKLITRIFDLGAVMISLRGNILRFQPPLVITEEQLQQAFQIIDQACQDVVAGKVELPSGDQHIGW